VFVVLQIFVRALFDYRPFDDDLIPCSQAGIEFKVSDVLRVRTYSFDDVRTGLENVFIGYFW